MNKASPLPFSQSGTSERFYLPDLRLPSRVHDVRNLRVSLKQWRMLHAVVDCGGYSDAAKHLHLSQSAISYTIAKLQEQLGVALLKIEGRKAHLTDAGRVLLDRSRYLIREAIELELLAEKLRQGSPVELYLAVDHEFPKQVLMSALRHAAMPEGAAKICLGEAGLEEAEKALHDRTAALAIMSAVPAGFLGDPLVRLEYIAVAHPNYPLCRNQRKLGHDDLNHKTQIIIAPHAEQTSHSPSSKLTRAWQVSSIETALLALKECLGYAWLPVHVAQPYLERNELSRLVLGQNSSYCKTFYLIHGPAYAHDPAVDALANALRQAAELILPCSAADSAPTWQTRVN